MKKEALLFGAVTVISLVVATVCHAHFPGVAPAIKPMFWPFAYLAIRLIVRANASRRRINTKREERRGK